MSQEILIIKCEGYFREIFERFENVRFIGGIYRRFSEAIIVGLKWISEET